jgi:hypothetical protein
MGLTLKRHETVGLRGHIPCFITVPKRFKVSHSNKRSLRAKTDNCVGRAADASLRKHQLSDRPGLREIEPGSADDIVAHTIRCSVLLSAEPPTRVCSMQQDIRFCKARDGVRLAYALSREGPQLVMSATWLTHLEHQ